MRTGALFLSLLGLCGFATDSRADKTGPPTTYKTGSADGKFVFVMRAPGTTEDELKFGNENHQKLVKEIRDTYPKSGLYKSGSQEPLWTVDWYKSSVRVASDGVHLIRFGGPHVLEERTKDKKERAITNNDLKQEALSVFAKGKLLREFSVGDLVDDPKQLRMSVSHFMWMKQTKILDDKQQLEVLTLDGNRVLIDIATAKIVEKGKVK